MNVTAVVAAIFCATYALIAARRLRFLPIGRPAGAMVGATLMVAVGALTPAESYAAVDADTILLLFATMALTGFLDRARFFDVVAAALLRRCRTPWQLLATLSLCAGVLSAFLVNDTVCVFMTPLVMVACERAKLPLGPYLIALPTSANIGSAATLVGNPQNMIVGSMSGYPFSEFLLHAGPAALAALLANLALLYLYYGRRLPATWAPPALELPRLDRRKLWWTGAVSLGVVAGYFAGLHMGYTALAGVALLIITERSEPQEAFARVDWTLLVFFVGLFVVVAGLAKTGLIAAAWTQAAPYTSLHHLGGAAIFTGLLVAASNVLSNVPTVLLVGPHLGQLGSTQLGWVLLAFISTVAGNLTLIGSVANIIVAERAKQVYNLTFLEYLRFGAVSTLLALLAGLPIIYFSF